MRTNFIPIVFSITIGGVGEVGWVQAARQPNTKVTNIARLTNILFFCGVTEFDSSPLLKVTYRYEVVFGTIALSHRKR